MHRSRSLLAAALLCACGPGGPTLATATQAQLGLYPAYDPDTIIVTGFQILLSSDQANGCLVLSDRARATVNGADAPSFVRGGTAVRPPNPFGVDRSVEANCILPSFEIPLELADQPELTLAFEDGDARASAAVQNMGRTPVVTVTPPADGHLRAGSTLGLTWAPATDDLSWMSGSFVSAPLPDGQTKFVSLDVTSFQRGFTIPADAPPGTATLKLDGIRGPQVTSCEGVERCDFHYALSLNDAAPAAVRAIKMAIEVEP